MTRYASVVRDDDWIAALSPSYWAPRDPSALTGRADFEDAALTVTAAAVAAAALDRIESRGCHHRADHPDPTPPAR